MAEIEVILYYGHWVNFLKPTNTFLPIGFSGHNNKDSRGKPSRSAQLSLRESGLLSRQSAHEATAPRY